MKDLNHQELTKKERRALKTQLKLEKRQKLEKQKKMKKNGLRLAVLLGLIALIFVIRSSGSSETGQNGLLDNLIVTDDERKRLLDIVDDDYIKGNKEAAVTLIEYLDFECEACGAYYPMVKQLSDELGDDVKFVSRYFPLPGHKNGMNAALAVEASGRQGKYWEMHDLLFENQKTWGEKRVSDPSIFEDYAKQLGLNLKQFEQDVDSKEVRERVRRDIDSGKKLGVNGTPSFFLNGEKIPNPKSLDDFKSFIQAAELQASEGSDQSLDENDDI
jgi:protein-disulfide isomerase